jgi:F-type H+-transporting ATPase subunit delta
MPPGSTAEPAEALRQLRDFDAMVTGSRELRNVLMSPAVSTARKRSVVAKLAPSIEMGEKVRNFLFVVIDHGRAGMLPSITEAFEAAIDERLGRVSAEIRTVSELSEQQKASLAAELARISGAGVRCEFGVDPELLGGATARVGSTVYDGTVSGRLQALRRRMVVE